MYIPSLLRLFRIALLSLLAGTALLGCGQQQTETDGLVIYSGRSDRFVQPVIDAYTAKTGQTVQLLSGKSTELLNRMKLEGERSQADLFISNDAGALHMGSEWALFSSLPKALTAAVPANDRAAKNDWTGLSARARVIVVNTDVVADGAIRSVQDLAAPQWAGKLAITSSSNESFIAGVSVYRELWGDAATQQWLQGLRRNAAGEAYAKHSAVVSDVAAGRKAVGLVNHYYVYRHLAKNPTAPIKLLLPDQQGIGVAWNVTGAAVAKHAKAPKAAAAFIEFVLSTEGQQLYAKQNNEYPIRADLAADPQLPNRSELKVADVPMAKLGSERAATVALIEAAGLP